MLLPCFLLSTFLPGAAQKDAAEDFRHEIHAANAIVLMLDVASGQPLLQTGDIDRNAAPGSVLKPFVLMTALQSGAVREHDTIACRGSLVIEGHNLACAHPRDITILDARQALASSCNTYFATLAERMPSATLVAGLQGFGVTALQSPRNGDDRALLGLGLQGVSVNAKQLGAAYVRLAQELDARHGSAESAVRDGLLQSVATGMASAARTKDVMLGGKTGTVDDKAGRSHGWFAGIMYRDASATVARRVIVVFVPNGNGADAASLARLVLLGERGLR